MLWTILLCLCATVGYAQEKLVTINVKNASLVQIFEIIEKQTDYRFSYRNVNIDNRHDISLSITRGRVQDVLDHALTQRNLSYTITSPKSIVIYKKSTANDESKGNSRATRQVFGTVKDMHGEPIIGASILEKGTQNGVVTDINGEFKISVQEGASLTISYLGFVTQDITIKKDENLKIMMVDDQKSLDEVVVIGYGTSRKSDLTGAVSSVAEGQFVEGVTTNAFQMINGKVAGVNVSQTSSAPGAPTKIQIRGAGSINSSNAALVVVDGMPGIDPSSINTKDIKSIEILKDASAAAIYGTRAANGVVLITTKRGSNSPLRIQFGAEVGIQSVAKRMDVLNGHEYMETLNAIRLESKHPDGALYSKEQIAQVGNGTDWQDIIFRNGAPVQDYKIGFSGGGAKHNYYVGLGVMNQKGLVKHSDLTKYNARVNFDLSPMKFMRLKFNLNYTRKDGSSIYEGEGVNEAAGVINSAIQFDPTLPTGKNPKTNRYYTNDYISLDNPQGLLNGMEINNHSNNTYGILALELEPLKDLVFTARAGATVNTYMNNFYRSRDTMTGLASGGVANKKSGEESHWLAEFIVNYKRSFKNIHHLSVMLGTTFEQFQSDYLMGNATGFLSDLLSYNNMHGGDTLNGDDVYSYKSQNRLNGFLGRFNYNLMDRYLLTASVRYDGTSRFSIDKKYAFFPSAAFAWRVSEEPFMKKFSNLSNLKLRLGYGQLGNQGINNYETLQTLITEGAAVFGDKLSQGVVSARLPNSNLRWETTEEFNIGIDFGFLGNRISGSIDFFIRDTHNQLFNKPLPASIGFQSIKVNAGNVRNEGMDFTLNTVNIDTKRFNWNTSFNLSLLKNKVLELPPYMPRLITGNITSFVSGFNITRVGDPIYSFYGYQVDGIFQKGDDIIHSAQPNAKPGDLKFFDADHDNSITSADRVILGKPFPDITFGLSNTFKYKGFTFDIFLQGVYGISTLDVNVLETMYPTNEYRNHIGRYYRERWTETNPSTKYPSGVNPTDYGGQYIVNSMTVVDASFLRIKNISLSYDIPLKKKDVIQAVQVYAAADNLCTFSKYDGFDPDASATGSNSIAKVNYNSYPLARVFRFGINLTF
ncbi:MAG: SusC/RagA family TonB-linked outer membrane protein [Phocaeicola sp.]|uniref:SusC/RagA family TonB-linked outer membrane protein n=1 Tax=Phocaeicola sp. TaxID=2773926 RepID=UPI003FA0B2F2